MKILYRWHEMSLTILRNDAHGIRKACACLFPNCYVLFTKACCMRSWFSAVLMVTGWTGGFFCDWGHFSKVLYPQFHCTLRIVILKFFKWPVNWFCKLTSIKRQELSAVTRLFFVIFIWSYLKFFFRIYVKIF